MSAEAQFQRDVQSGLASNDHGSGPQPVERDTSPDEECHFEIFRKDESRMTSTRFSGGDWHWRLSDAEGLILLDTGGYPSERKCREAIIILKETAAFASVSREG